MYNTIVIGDEVKTDDGWSKITKLDLYKKDVVTYTLNVVNVDENIVDDINDNFYVMVSVLITLCNVQIHLINLICYNGFSNRQIQKFVRDHNHD